MPNFFVCQIQFQEESTLLEFLHGDKSFPHADFATVSSWSCKFAMLSNRKLLALKVTSLWTNVHGHLFGFIYALCYAIIKIFLKMVRLCAFPERMSWMCSHAQQARSGFLEITFWFVFHQTLLYSIFQVYLSNQGQLCDQVWSWSLFTTLIWTSICRTFSLIIFSHFHYRVNYPFKIYNMNLEYRKGNFHFMLTLNI